MALLQVPITKAKGKFVEINTETIPVESYEEALLLGLKVLANRGTSKITKTTYPNAEELAAAAVAAANAQVEAINAGTIKRTGAKKAKGASGAVMTEARRLAKNLVKDAMKAEGMKISHVAAKDITAAANELLNTDETIIEQAKANLAEREKTPIKIDKGILALVKEDPKLVAKAEAKKAKDTLSAKQAGKTAPRKKGKAPQATA